MHVAKHGVFGRNGGPVNGYFTCVWNPPTCKKILGQDLHENSFRKVQEQSTYRCSYSKTQTEYVNWAPRPVPGEGKSQTVSEHMVCLRPIVPLRRRMHLSLLYGVQWTYSPSNRLRTYRKAWWSRPVSVMRAWSDANQAALPMQTSPVPVVRYAGYANPLALPFGRQTVAEHGWSQNVAYSSRRVLLIVAINRVCILAGESSAVESLEETLSDLTNQAKDSSKKAVHRCGRVRLCAAIMLDCGSLQCVTLPHTMPAQLYVIQFQVSSTVVGATIIQFQSYLLGLIQNVQTTNCYPGVVQCSSNLGTLGNRVWHQIFSSVGATSETNTSTCAPFE